MLPESAGGASDGDGQPFAQNLLVDLAIGVARQRIMRDVQRFRHLVVREIDGQSTMDDFVFTLNKIGIFSNHLELWGTGKPMREFLWSEDLADACVYIMENVNYSDLRGDKEDIRNCHINIGTGKEVSIKELSFLTADIVGYAGKIKFNPSKPDGTMRKLTDVSKLESLGWKYKVELEEGIRRMYHWYLSDQEENA